MVRQEVDGVELFLKIPWLPDNLLMLRARKPRGHLLHGRFEALTVASLVRRNFVDAHLVETSTVLVGGSAEAKMVALDGVKLWAMFGQVRLDGAPALSFNGRIGGVDEGLAVRYWDANSSSKYYACWLGRTLVDDGLSCYIYMSSVFVS